MWDRIFDPSALLFFVLAAGAAFVAGLWTGTARRRRLTDILGRAGEAAALAALGGFLARTFVSLLLSAGRDSAAAALAVGWGFFLWPGAIDTLLELLGVPPLFTPTVLRWTAAVVGSLIGMTDGLGRIHRWRGAGVPTFALDVTWGLAGGTNGCFVHLFNLARAVREDAPRSGTHRYFDGFRVKAGYAVTLGAVMSNLPAHSGDLIRHERVHVLQNRLFGPFYTLTYIGWMAVMLLPALLVGLAKGAPGRTVEDWCYVNNPWEAWAYTRGGWLDPARVWGRAAFRAVAAAFFAAALGGFGWVVWLGWLR